MMVRRRVRHGLCGHRDARRRQPGRVQQVAEQGARSGGGVKTLQRAGLEVQGGFIVGFDSDTPSIFQRQIEFIQRSGIVTAMVGLLQAPYGTELYERLAKRAACWRRSRATTPTTP